jgi:rRNA maturation endonuclease Nob1
MKRNAHLEIKHTCRYRACRKTFDEAEKGENGRLVCPECGWPIRKSRGSDR